MQQYNAISQCSPKSSPNDFVCRCCCNQPDGCQNENTEKGLPFCFVSELPRWFPKRAPAYPSGSFAQGNQQVTKSKAPETSASPVPLMLRTVPTKTDWCTIAFATFVKQTLQTYVSHLELYAHP